MKRFSKVTVILTSVVLASLACFEGSLTYWCIQSRNSEERELFALTGLIVFISTMLVMAGMWLHYLEIRWLYIPYWRWMTGGFKGKPNTPLGRFVITREQIAEAKQKMSRSQHVWMWVGNVCSGLGAFLLLTAVIWRLVLSITGKATIDSTANMLFLIGFLIIISGSGVVRICIGRTGN